MADFNKHRNESLQLAIDLDSALNEGDSLSSVDNLEVVENTGSGWQDRSSQFGTPSGAISGTQVDFTLGAASTDEQAAGTYIVYLEVSTSDGETLVETSTLRVSDTGDTTAP